MNSLLPWVGTLFCALAFLVSLKRGESQNGAAIVWRMDDLQRIGGHKTTILGSPKLINLPQDKAIEFDGMKDGLHIDSLPLAGWK